MDAFKLRKELIESFINQIDEVVNYDKQLNDKIDDFDQLRDEIVDGLHDSYFEVLDDYLIYYNDQYNIINSLRLIYDFEEDNDLGIEITNIGDLAFVNLYKFVNDEGLLYDAVDDYLEREGYITTFNK